MNSIEHWFCVICEMRFQSNSFLITPFAFKMWLFVSVQCFLKNIFNYGVRSSKKKDMINRNFYNRIEHFYNDSLEKYHNETSNEYIRKKQVLRFKSNRSILVKMCDVIFICLQYIVMHSNEAKSRTIKVCFGLFASVLTIKET